MCSPGYHHNSIMATCKLGSHKGKIMLCESQVSMKLYEVVMVITRRVCCSIHRMHLYMQ